ncbi:hypothetical protein MVES_003775 [Malassezia vespertilionis]|uniref:Abscisic acid G-protein coupled receptor-like domain-containing protein n=2 Tax=Malassezia vespertilionis TaxID=2020962 RepID=A0A2N1J6W2_9BASI|nr:hypothetical protein MVES_003775 [Malassezia vespertilionis]
MASVALFVGWCFAFFRIPVPSTVQPAITGLYGAVLSRAGVLGISMIAVLSGTAAAGAMCDSYEMLSLRRKKKWREMDVDGAEASFVRTCTDLQARRASARMLEADIEADGPRTGISRYFTRSSKDKELAALHTEITGLAMMASVMRSDLDVMQAQQRRIRYSRTVFGRILLACGYLFSLYCAFRIVQCLLNLVFFGYNTGASPDFVSTCFAYAVRMFGMDIDVHTWAPRIAFLFLGGLICMRMRVILSSLSSMINALSSGTSTDLLVLFTAQVLCIYTLAALIQLHTNVATEPGTPHRTSKLLASLPEFQRVFGGMFDFVFLLTASATAGYRWYCWRSDVAAL